MKRISISLLLLLSMLCISAQHTPDTFLKKMQTTSWKKSSDYFMNFKVPSFFSQREVYVEEVPSSVVIYKSGQVELDSWSLLGNWATQTDNYPVPDCCLNDKVKIKKVTYSSNTGIYSGYATDGRIFYMKVHYSGGVVSHAASLILLYPKSYQKSVGKLIEVVRKW